MTEKGIILKCYKHSEADLIFHLLTASGSIRHFIAASALKSKKRFGGGILEPTHFVEVVFREKINSELQSCQEAKLLEGFEKLRVDYDRLNMGLYFLSLISKVAKENLESPDLFHLLGNALRVLEKSENINLLKLHFEIRLLAYQGVLPQIEGTQSFLQNSLPDHGRVEIAPQNLNIVQNQIHHLLQQYVGR